jgi:5-methylcytosine-specific restriction endonuclease McrA
MSVPMIEDSPYKGTGVTSPELGRLAQRGNAGDQKRRREWLVATFRANLDVLVIRLGNGSQLQLDTLLGRGEPACRCYRCGKLLTADTVTVDRIVPGCQGGTHRRSNIRPACGPCNSVTGATTRVNRS